MIPIAQPPHNLSRHTEVQYRVKGANSDWEGVVIIPGVNTTFSPAGGAECGSTYEFRVKAYGDGAAYSADWGVPTAAAPVATGACRQ